MEALRQMLIVRTGYPRYGALAQAARESGVAQSLLSRYIDQNDQLKPEPPQLERLAAYLDVPYNDLLVQVWGKQAAGPHKPRPVTPHDRALKTADVMAAAVAELRDSLLAMRGESQPHNVSRKKRTAIRTQKDYVWETVDGEIILPLLKFPRLVVLPRTSAA